MTGAFVYDYKKDVVCHPLDDGKSLAPGPGDPASPASPIASNCDIGNCFIGKSLLLACLPSLILTRDVYTKEM